mmetsp:Transcript_753/g.1486  ORF Transcript_753/g.1486 Transcript_753/m.1486 type:complete len:227 (-) Transcript_753:7302-7982(-)
MPTKTVTMNPSLANLKGQSMSLMAWGVLTMMSLLSQSKGRLHSRMKAKTLSRTAKCLVRLNTSRKRGNYPPGAPLKDLMQGSCLVAPTFMSTRFIVYWATNRLGRTTQRLTQGKLKTALPSKVPLKSQEGQVPQNTPTLTKTVPTTTKCCTTILATTAPLISTYTRTHPATKARCSPLTVVKPATRRPQVHFQRMTVKLLKITKQTILVTMILSKMAMTRVKNTKI